MSSPGTVADSKDNSMTDCGPEPTEQGDGVDTAMTTCATAQRIRLSDMTLSCRIGVTEEERAQRQRLRIDIILEISPSPPREDKITEVVSYGPLVAKIRKVCESVEYRLLESLAGALGAACLGDPRVLLARVRIEKLDRYADVGGIGCEIDYRRTVD